MKAKNTLLTLFLVLPLGTAFAADVSPEEELVKFQNYFKEKFPEIPFQDFSNGVYAVDPASREQWEALEEFPPYEIDIEEGKRLFETPFKNGKTYADCFENGGIGIAQNYPYFDAERNEVVTLPLAINRCREENGEPPLKYKKGKLAKILAYMVYTSRGNTIDVKIPNEKALEAWKKGRQFYFSRRGQLNLACAHCHLENAGRRIRADILSPALGHPTHFPVYRSKWGELGTLHRRFAGCNKQVRAKPFKAQSEEYRNLEYFLTYMSNGLQINGPGVRK